MIAGGKITYVKASREGGRPAGVKVSIELTGVSARGNGLEVGFAYLADYGVGALRMRGSIFTREESAERAAFLSAAFKEKRLPAEVFRELVDAVNRLCSAEGAFVVTPLELAPPMKPLSLRGMLANSRAG
ncbi:MAG: hypothetical protein QXH27_04745 [Candidatus Micrarchaeia archaeon]